MDFYNHKGELDRHWYLRKLSRALKARLPELVTHEALIGAKPDQRIRIAVHKLEEPDFRYQPPGGTGQGAGAGDGQDGDDVVWIEMTTEELMNLWLEDLKLPRLEEKPQRVLEDFEDRFDDVTRHGPLSNIDKRRSLYEAASKGRDYLTEEDLRYRSWRTHEKPISSAVITLVRDASGSMDETKRYLSKSAAWWIVQWIQRQYRHSTILYYLHTTVPVKVDENDFFNREISGGTAVLATYQEILSLWRQQYPSSSYNHYLLHFSDGEIWSGSESTLVNTVTSLLNEVSLLGYFEVQGYPGHRSPLWKLYEAAARSTPGGWHPAMRLAEIQDKEDVLGAIRTVISEKDSSA